VVHAAVRETTCELRGGNQNSGRGVEKFHRASLSKQLWSYPDFVVVSALCADLVEPQARRYTKLGHHQKLFAGWIVH